MKRYMLLAAVLISLIFVTGCWGKRELSELGIVIATGVDKEPDGSLRITVVAIEPVGFMTTPSDRSTAWIGSATGTSLMDASKKLRRISSKRLVWFHSRIIIIGQEMTKAGLREVMDYFFRNREIRYDSYVMISEGRAADILQVPADIQKNLPAEIQGTIKIIDEWSRAYVPYLKDFLISLSDKHLDTIAGRIAAPEIKESTFSTYREEYEKLYWKNAGIGTAIISGSAVLKDEKFAGWLSEEETRGYMWITGKAKPGVLVVEGTEKEGKVAMQSISSKSRLSPGIEGNKIVMNVKLDVNGIIVEQTSNEDLKGSGDLDKVEKSLAEAMENEMRQIVSKAQTDYKSDIFDFCGYVMRKYPKVWKKIEKDWEEIFTNMEVRYQVKVNIKRMGSVSDIIF